MAHPLESACVYKILFLHIPHRTLETKQSTTIGYGQIFK